MREDQLQRALRTSAPRVSTTGVLEEVASKRARRRTRRRIELAAVAAIVVATASLTVVLAGDRGPSTRVTTPAGRVITGDAAVTGGAGTTRAPVPVALDPDQGYVRGPLVVRGATLSLAAYDHDDNGFHFPPSRIVRIDSRTFREEGRTDLKAEILSIADGDGARWVVTRNPKPPNGLPDAFLKRIGPDGGVQSTLLPPGSDPVGRIAVGAGAVWIPLRDGVLRYDTTALQFTARYDLAPSDTRVVAFTTHVVATDRGDLVALRPDGTVGGLSAGTLNRDRVVALTTSSGGDLLRLTVSRTSSQASVGSERLPRGFTAATLTASNGRVWVEGTVGGSPAVVLLREDGPIQATIVLDDAHDASFAWVRSDTVLAVSNGVLLRIDLKTAGHD
jgi:hypothetical protein